jgi:hypothetical protein
MSTDLKEFGAGIAELSDRQVQFLGIILAAVRETIHQELALDRAERQAENQDHRREVLHVLGAKR